ncbi:MAG: metal ABC transporter substrate-binding protein [Clostridiaceae bacterium]|nr:metal ABC transporter substrate-binding protein [Clostridiaceae bacterium]MDY5015943.1 metal ABC transporter substrate-binding protein [Eubacteriales bacterium]
MTLLKTMLPLAMALLVLLSACAAEPEKTDSARLRVVTSFSPVYLIAKEVAANIDGVSLENMAPAQAGCLHDYQLTMDDRKLLEKADVFLACGGGMESFLGEIADAHTALVTAEAVAGASLLPSATGETEYNAHLWMSAEGACVMAANIAHTLGEADPAYAEDYRANADAFSKKVRAQRDEYREKLAAAENRNIVIFHESFDYAAHDFGLNVVGIIAKEPDEEPSAKEINEVCAAVREYGVQALFADTQYDDRAAETVSQETGAAVYAVNSLVGADAGEKGYLELMRENYEVLAQALCGEGNG